MLPGRRTKYTWLVASVVLLLAFHASALSVRRFGAVAKASHLRRRGLDFEPHYGNHMLLFEDESSTESAARVHLAPKQPTLVLEDISAHLKKVTCSSSEMIIHFHAIEAMTAAVNSWKNGVEFSFISAYTTCAEVGTHEPYLVKYKSAHAESRSVVLAARKQTFKEATHRISIDLGAHVLNDLRPKIKRQLVTGTLMPSATTNVQVAPLPATNSFNFQPPTGLPVGTKGTSDISFSAKDKAILPPDDSIVALFPGTGPLSSMYLGCKDCSMSGSLTLEAAGFQINSSQLGQIMDFFDEGFFQFTANKLAAHMNLEFGLLPGFTPIEYVANLTRFPLVPIEIPKVLKLGPAIELTVPLGITLNSPVNFTTGFDLSVPDGSTIILNVSEISGSSQTGFDKTTFKHLPFTANTDNLNFNLTAGLKPRLVVSAGVGSTSLPLDVEGGVGAFIDFPRLSTNIAVLQNVNATCNGPAVKGTTNRAIRILPSAIFNLGLHWELGLKLGTFTQWRGGEQVLATQSFSLPGQCLVFNNKTGSLVPADSSNASSSGSGSNTASSSAPGPLEFSTTGKMHILLVVVASFFVSVQMSFC